MNYPAIGVMSGSSLDGLDMVLADFHNDRKGWKYRILTAECSPFSAAWKKKLTEAVELNAREYMLLDAEFGRYCGNKINTFLNQYPHVRPVVIGSHGHTTFHMPEKGMTHQIGNGATIAATTKIPVVSDMRSLDTALGGQGAPIVPIGEKLLFPEFRYFMNIGGICNVSIHTSKVTAFDVCPANRVLNMLAGLKRRHYDRDGKIASRGHVTTALLQKLNALNYYRLPYPKSLANDFGVEVIYPLLTGTDSSVEDAMATYCEHIAIQVKNSLAPFAEKKEESLLVTGGGAFNSYLMQRIAHHLDALNIRVVVPDAQIVKYKEALIMALIAVLRLRGEDNVLASVTGAQMNSSGGAMWIVK